LGSTVRRASISALSAFGASRLAIVSFVILVIHFKPSPSCGKLYCKSHAPFLETPPDMSHVGALLAWPKACQ
jgi:hypothetical protein